MEHKFKWHSCNDAYMIYECDTCGGKIGIKSTEYPDDTFRTGDYKNPPRDINERFESSCEEMLVRLTLRE